VDITNREISPGSENPPVAMAIQRPIAPNRFRSQGIAKNRESKFPAKNFQPADMVAMFVGEKHTIELVRCDPALFEPKDELSRAETAVHEQSAMIGRDERAISGTAAAEHGQTEHARSINRDGRYSQTENVR
jgi:hypothetical protein